MKEKNHGLDCQGVPMVFRNTGIVLVLFIKLLFSLAAALVLGLVGRAGMLVLRETSWLNSAIVSIPANLLFMALWILSGHYLIQRLFPDTANIDERLK